MYDLKGSWERDKIDGFSSKIKLRPKQNTFDDNLWQQRSTKMSDFAESQAKHRKQRNVHNSGFFFIRGHFNSFCSDAVLTQFSVHFFLFGSVCARSVFHTIRK